MCTLYCCFNISSSSPSSSSDYSIDDVVFRLFKEPPAGPQLHAFVFPDLFGRSRIRCTFHRRLSTDSISCDPTNMRGVVNQVQTGDIKIFVSNYLKHIIRGSEIKQKIFYFFNNRNSINKKVIEGPPLQKVIEGR